MEWRYYNDGKVWLGKVIYKKKDCAMAFCLPRIFYVQFSFHGENQRWDNGFPFFDDLQ
ncbi:MAG: hypothetical protein GX905_00005 [Bacteroidales bacterium]|nr:hypothetical protein [Bacteroidales bacterium]